MHIYIGSDHGGSRQKALLAERLKDAGYEVTDCGSYSSESTDYPDFAVAVAKAVTGDTENPKGIYQPAGDKRGILLCRSGEGMDMAANKFPGVRAALVWDVKVAEETRRDNDANIIVLPSDFLADDTAVQFAKIFMETPFSQAERHVRRLQKLHAIENVLYGER